MRRAPNVGAVLTAAPNHKGRWPTPLFVFRFYNWCWASSITHRLES